MKKLNVVGVLCFLMIFVFVIETKAELPVVWQTDLSHPSQESITRIKMTPDNQSLMVFGISSYHGCPIVVDKMDASDGSFVWSKELTKSGERLAYGWVDDDRIKSKYDDLLDIFSPAFQ